MSETCLTCGRTPALNGDPAADDQDPWWLLAREVEKSMYWKDMASRLHFRLYGEAPPEPTRQRSSS